MTERLAIKHEALHRPTHDELVALAGEAGGLAPGGALKRLAGGHNNDVYSYEAPDGKLVMRVPRDADGLVAVRADYDWLLELEGRHAPRAIAFAEVNGTPVALVECIEGKHRNDLNLLRQAEVSELAAAMAEIHAKTSPLYSGRSGTKPTRVGTHADYLRAMVREGVDDRLRPYDAALPGFPGATDLLVTGAWHLEKIITNHPDDFSGTTFCRLHHDLNPGNIMWEPSGNVVFLDANPTYGDVCDDVNYVVSNNGGSEEFQGRLLAAYADAAPGTVISPVRMKAYTLKNWLDDLAWTIDKCEKHKGDPRQYQLYWTAYETRAEALGLLLGG